MSQPSPPKPWERNGAAPGLSSSLAPPLPPMSTTTTTAPAATTTAVSSASGAPPVPQRPASLTNPALAAAGVNPYNSIARPGYGMAGGLGGYGMGGMGGMGGIGMGAYSSPYSSPYSRFGGGMGGYGMGGYGAGMGGYGGMDPNDPYSMSRSMENSTAATFQMIESIVSAFGGFAQMLESTFMATHSSFFAMVRVAEQFGNLKNTLGSILGIFTILRWCRTLLAKVTGRPLPAAAGDLTAANFASFEGRGAPKPSKKPFLFFVAAVFGLPFLMGKLIRALAAKQEEEERRRLAENPAANPNMDPSKLEFCRVVYDFTPEQNNGVELEVKKGDLVAVLSKSDPMGNPSQWWRCRARDARVGYLPSPYLESIVKKDVLPSAKQIENGTASRTGTMTSAVARPAVVEGKAGDITIESFQKSGFNS